MTAALTMLIVAALLLGFCGLAALWWAMSHGQFDDPEGDARRILIDDESDDGAASSWREGRRAFTAPQAISDRRSDRSPLSD
jgi:cbb3-type cytochrome oxidase maturation protein